MNRRALIQICCIAFALSIAGNVIAQDSAAPSLKAGAYTFTGQKDWKSKKKKRAMSAGGLTYTGKGGPLDADFYHFGAGAGGSVEANIARWQGQFEGKPEPKKETKKYGEVSVHIISLEGTFLSGRPVGPKKAVKDQAMLGAIIESKSGHVFVKLVGAKKSVAQAEAAFKALCSSPFAKKK